MGDVRTTPVTEIMSTQIEMVAESTPISYVARLMRDKEISGMPVTSDDGVLIGVISASDLLRAVPGAKEGAPVGSLAGFYAEIKPSVLITPELFERALEGTVGELMTKMIVSVPIDATVQHAAQVMIDSGVHRLLVLDRNENLAGLVTAMDIVRHVAG